MPLREYKTEHSRTALMAPSEQELPNKTPQFLAAFLATVSALSMGMCLSWSSPAIPLLQREDSSLKVTDGQGAWIGSLITLGACLGAIPAGSLSNAVGRKRTLLILSLPLFLSWIIIAFGNNVYALYGARFLAGLAIGAISVAAPMYVAELAHKSIRGTLGTFFQVQITIGLLVEYTLGGFIYNFQMLALISSAFPIVFLVSFAFMPESPVFLYSKGKMEEARNSLTWFRGDSYNIEDELRDISDAIKEAQENQVQLSDLFSCKANFKGLIISLGLMVFQQLSGINAVIFYTSNIFKESGSSMTPSNCAIMVGALMVISTLASTVLIDRLGRKVLLLISDMSMVICLAVLGVYFYVKQYQDMSEYSIIPILSVGSFIVLFSIGYGPIPWMIMGEIFPPKMKGIAGSMAACINWTIAFTVTNQFQNMVTWFGTGVTFLIFSIICALGTVFVALLVPETKGKTVNEVRDILLGNKSAKKGFCIETNKQKSTLL